ncbi:MAG: M15 family metallopeptidase [Methylovulum sp.]|nr:M15 family metallopeptidase [Methylovulum sp.]
MAKAILLTAADCLAHIGNPINEKGMTLWDVPPALEIGVIPKRVYCHQALVGPLAKAFSALIQSGEVQFLKTWDGCFNIRTSKGGSSPSLHSWGLAVDVNAAWNQFGKPPNLRPQFVKCFTDAGFDWGGTWSTPDGMHFQLKQSLFAAGSGAAAEIATLAKDVATHTPNPTLAAALALTDAAVRLLATLDRPSNTIQAATRSIAAAAEQLRAENG